MKKLGIIGGAGPLASALFYESLILEGYRQHHPLPKILLINYPFQRGLTHEEGMKNASHLQKALLDCIKTFKKAKIYSAILICNTLHLELKRLPGNLIHFYLIPQLVLNEIKTTKAKKLLLLGTQNTCLSSLYDQEGISILRLSSENQKILNRIIDDVLVGKITKENSIQIEDMIRTFSEPVDGVILGCTDLPVLHHHFPIVCNFPIFDSVKIPAKSIVKFL
jgi:aspartate racemase